MKYGIRINGRNKDGTIRREFTGRVWDEKAPAFLLDTRSAIDFSKIYLITLNKGLSKGTTLRFDTGTKKIEIIKKGQKLYEC